MAATTRPGTERRPPTRGDPGPDEGDRRRTLTTRIAGSTPGMTPGAPYRNLALGAGYLTTLAVLVAVLVTAAVTYRPYRGC